VLLSGRAMQQIWLTGSAACGRFRHKFRCSQRDCQRCDKRNLTVGQVKAGDSAGVAAG
jgi:hypothetical protein